VFFTGVRSLVSVKGDEKKKTQAEVVRGLIERVEEKLAGDEVKVTLADYIRLVQLRKELEEDEPREIRVTWVKRDGESSSED
jgi:hypothetical protein